MSINRGFTLLELVIAIAVASILLTVGVPSFLASTQQNCAISSANGLLNDLLLARSEAIKRGKTVALCKTGAGSACVRDRATSWSSGSVTFQDDDHDGVLDAGERTIAVESSHSTCGTITTNKFVNYISFNGEGIANSNGSFFIKANNAPDVTRTVSVFSGRVRVCNPGTDRNCPASE